ncbi:MAG: hypothetical protein M1814_001829 [Vezdaea aestivalis]|nr:MAG: hypothetical protein M1814_001829 [Vezdaea aestivalis]
MPPKILHPKSTTNLTLSPQTYIYALTPYSNGLAAISSAHTLSLIPPTLTAPFQTLTTPGADHTCLASYDDNTVVTGSRDGIVRFWDVSFHPTNPAALLSGSTDGLLNVYNSTLADEDEALERIINHGSVHHARFIDSKGTICAVSHNEVLSVYEGAEDMEGEEKEEEVTALGDVRSVLGCEYVVDVCALGEEEVLIPVGKTEGKPGLILTPLRRGGGGKWAFERDEAVLLPGAHGEEIVRSVYVDGKIGAVYTAGEDGAVRLWREIEADEDVIRTSKTGKSARSSLVRKEAQYKPY